MCGRYEFQGKDFPDIEKYLAKDLGVREVFPGEAVPLLTDIEEATEMIWGFSPPWLAGKRVINARQETLLQKPLFVEGFLHHRLALPASAYYEWAPGPAGQKERFRLGYDQGPFYLAGVGKSFPQGAACVVITTAAHPSIASIHDRMPLLLRDDDLPAWFGDVDQARAFLRRPGAALSSESLSPQGRLF